YLVDSIQDHYFDDEKGCTYFHIKWQGHESRKEWTWEPQENLEIGGDALVENYFASLAKRRKRARKSANKRPSPTGTNPSIKPGKRSESYRLARPSRTPKSTWEPPRGTWENESFHIDGCQGDSIEDLMIYVTWPGGHKTKQKMDFLCKKCPQKVSASLFRYNDQVCLVRLIISFCL
ncbi:hypothetical protein FPOAC2_13880, partial [Fusarium poae]